MTPLDAAIAWIQKGFSPVPVPHRSKRPVLQGWERLEITIDVAPQYFNGKPQNIGLHLGDKYGSTDVDCDCAEAITAARELLPETGLIFGRLSKPFSHFFYRSDPPVRTVQFIDPLDHTTLVELRGLSSDGTVGLQTVVPPSIHETGEPIRFEAGFEGTPANVDAEAFNKFRQFRNQLLNLPDRVAAMLAAENDSAKVHEILAAEVRQVLNEFADSNS